MKCSSMCFFFSEPVEKEALSTANFNNNGLDKDRQEVEREVGGGNGTRRIYLTVG